jgi:hypothetical protein
MVGDARLHRRSGLTEAGYSVPRLIAVVCDSEKPSLAEAGYGVTPAWTHHGAETCRMAI